MTEEEKERGRGEKNEWMRMRERHIALRVVGTISVFLAPFHFAFRCGFNSNTLWFCSVGCVQVVGSFWGVDIMGIPEMLQWGLFWRGLVWGG